MRYQGGKTKIADEISRYILATTSNHSILVSLFCGACSIECKLSPYFEKIICNDSHPQLISLLNAVSNGWIPPEYVSEEEYKYIKQHQNEDMILAGFVGFGCSFGGRYFEGYARSVKPNGEPRNYAMESRCSLLRDIAPLNNVEFVCGDYKDVELPDGCTVYADPPYTGTKQISRQPFNTDEFWDYMRLISKNHNVFISEQSAPDDFEVIWEQRVTRTLDRNKSNYFKATEKLFKYKY